MAVGSFGENREKDEHYTFGRVFPQEGSASSSIKGFWVSKVAQVWELTEDA